jgi:hypothetical protein
MVSETVSEFLLEGGAIHFRIFHEMVDGGRAHEFVASSWQLEGGYHSYERPLCPRAAACEVHDAY